MSPKNKFLIALVGGVALHTVIIAGAGLPLFTRIKTSYESLLGSRLQLATLEKKEQLLTDLERAVTELGPSIGRIEVSFFKPEEVVPFIVALEEIAKTSNVLLRKDTAEISVEKDGTKISTFQINAQGTFAQIYQFTTLLQNMPYSIDLTDVQISSRGVSGSGENLVAESITLQVLTATGE